MSSLKSIGSFAPILGLIPGVGPALAAGAGVLGGLSGGSQSQGQANNINGQMAQQAGFGGQMQQQYLPQALQMLFSAAGNQNPFGDQTQQNAQTNPLVFGDLANRSMTPAWNTAISQYGDSVGNNTNQVNGGTAHALGGRGFYGNNSLSPALYAANERGAQQDVGRNRAAVGAEAANAMQQLAQYQQQQQYNQAVNKGNTMFSRLQSATGAIPGANIGGLQAAGQNYQNLANGANESFLGGLKNFDWQHIFGHKNGTPATVQNPGTTQNGGNTLGIPNINGPTDWFHNK